MRVLVAASLLLALAAGCLDGGPSSDTGDDAGPAAAPTAPAGVTTSPGAALPAAFAGGFRVDAVHTGLDGPEPNVGVTPSGAVFATALETIVRSTDGGLSWEPVYQMAVGFTSDPMLWVDPDTGRVLSPQMFPTLLCSSFIMSDDDGATWLEAPGASCGSPGVDHQKVASGPYPDGVALPATAVYPNLVTYCYNKILATVCAMSVDGGLRFAYESTVDFNSILPQVELEFAECGGLNGHQHHARDGTIYIPYGFNCGQAVVAVSTDAGMSWTVRRLGVPNMGLDPEVTSTPDGTAYMFYKSVDGKVYLARSKDRFVTTEGPYLVSPPGVETTAFLGMTAGSDGRVVMGYLGTSDDAKIEDDVDEGSAWNAYVTMTVDAAADPPTFVTVQANPDGDPVQRGSICQNRGCVDGNRNLLDFVDLHAGPDGRFYFAFADGCTSRECLSPDGTPADSRSSELTVARLSVGPSLQADRPAFTA